MKDHELRQKYPLNAIRPAVQDEVIELINSEVTKVLDEVWELFDSCEDDYQFSIGLQTLKERYK